MSVEQVLGFAWEQSLQRAFLALPDVVAALNLFYFVGHFLITAIFFLWLYHRSRDGFRSFRDGFLAATAIAVVIHWLFPTAPPRLAGVGLEDTLLMLSGIDIGSPTLVRALESRRRGAVAARGVCARGRDRDDPLRPLAPDSASRARSTRRSSCSRSSSPATTSCSTPSPAWPCSVSASGSRVRSAAAPARTTGLRRLSRLDRRSRNARDVS